MRPLPLTSCAEIFQQLVPVQNRPLDTLSGENWPKACSVVVAPAVVFGLGDGGDDLFVDFGGFGDGLPDSGRVRFVLGGDFDGAGAGEAFADGVGEAGAGDLAQGAVEDVHVEDAGKADDAEVGEDVDAAGPLEQGPHDAAGGEEDGGFGVGEAGGGAVVEQLGGDGDDRGGGGEAQGAEDDVPEGGFEHKEDEFAVAEDVAGDEGGETGAGRAGGGCGDGGGCAFGGVVGG